MAGQKRYKSGRRSCSDMSEPCKSAKRQLKMEHRIHIHVSDVQLFCCCRHAVYSLGRLSGMMMNWSPWPWRRHPDRHKNTPYPVYAHCLKTNQTEKSISREKSGLLSPLKAPPGIAWFHYLKRLNYLLAWKIRQSNEEEENANCKMPHSKRTIAYKDQYT